MKVRFFNFKVLASKIMYFVECLIMTLFLIKKIAKGFESLICVIFPPFVLVVFKFRQKKKRDAET